MKEENSTFNIINFDNKPIIDTRIRLYPFKEFYKEYDGYRSIHVRFNTRNHDKSTVKFYFKDYMNVDVYYVFQYDNMKKIYEEILHSNNTASYRNRSFGVVRQMGKYAYQNKYITLEQYNDVLTIFENIPEGMERHKTKAIWDEDEWSMFFASITDPFDFVLFSLEGDISLRIGELAALSWDAFDEMNGTIRVKQQVCNLGNHKLEVTSDLKTINSYRICPLIENSIRMLNRYKTICKSETYLFPSIYDHDKPMSTHAIRDRFNKIIKKAKIKPIKFHAFRHMKATRFISICQDMQEMKAAAEYLGHTLDVFMNTYAHVTNRISKEIVQRLEQKEITGKGYRIPQPKYEIEE